MRLLFSFLFLRQILRNFFQQLFFLINFNQMLGPERVWSMLCNVYVGKQFFYCVPCAIFLSENENDFDEILWLRLYWGTIFYGKQVPNDYYWFLFNFLFIYTFLFLLNVCEFRIIGNWCFVQFTFHNLIEIWVVWWGNVWCTVWWWIVRWSNVWGWNIGRWHKWWCWSGNDLSCWCKGWSSNNWWCNSMVNCVSYE